MQNTSITAKKLLWNLSVCIHELSQLVGLCV